MTNLLNQFKSIFKDNDHKLFNSYSSARLKQYLVKYHSLEICFRKEQGKKIQISLFTVVHFNIAKNYTKGTKGWQND